ncbi:CYTH domain-containing protein [bacterium]|nr:CYTH domain-containing protein [bacterium]
MTHELEQELKFQIAGPAEFEKVLSFLGPAEKLLNQCNYYFSDRADRVSPDWSLRVRQENDLFELTFKLGQKQSEGYFQATEVECLVDKDQADELLYQPVWSETLWELPPLQRLRQEFGVERLVLLGSLRNQRHRCPQAGGWVAELDITQFPNGQTDYELEVETADVEGVRQALKPVDEYLAPQSKTKFRRFLERFSKL